MVSIWIISLGHSILKLILSASNCLLDLAVRFAGVPDKLIAVAPLTCGNPWISLGILLTAKIYARIRDKKMLTFVFLCKDKICRKKWVRENWYFDIFYVVSISERPSLVEGSIENVSFYAAVDINFSSC